MRRRSEYVMMPLGVDLPYRWRSLAHPAPPQPAFSNAATKHDRDAAYHDQRQTDDPNLKQRFSIHSPLPSAKL